jgi:hypothetical protein
VAVVLTQAADFDDCIRVFAVKKRHVTVMHAASVFAQPSSG